MLAHRGGKTLVGEGDAELLRRARAHKGANDGAHAAACHHPGQLVLVLQPLDHTQVEGAVHASAAQHQCRAPEDVPHLLLHPAPREGSLGFECTLAVIGTGGPEGELLLQRNVQLLGDDLELQAHLLGVLLDDGRHAHAVVYPGLGHVAKAAQQVRSKREHHVAHVLVLAVRLQGLQPVHHELLVELLVLWAGLVLELDRLEGPRGLDPLLVGLGLADVPVELPQPEMAVSGRPTEALEV
eukprot:842075-Prorocentrum_minimum.AAC.2